MLPAAVILGGGEIKMEAVAVQAPVLVAVTVYVPAVLTTILAEVCPVLHIYVTPPVAVRFTLPVTHNKLTPPLILGLKGSSA